METEAVSAFFLAARDVDTVTVRKMLSTAGAESLLNYQNALGDTPLIFAAGKGHEAVTKHLLETRCNVDLHEAKFGFTPLHFAAANGHAAVTKQLLATHCNVDPQVSSRVRPLFISAQNGHASVTEQLIAARCNVDLQGSSGTTDYYWGY